MNDTAVIDPPQAEATSTAEQPPSTGAPKIPTAAPPTYDELKDRWQQITSARHKLSEREREEIDASEYHKECKKATESAQAELNNLIDDLNRPTSENLFRAHEQSQRENGDGNPDSPDEQAMLDKEDGKGPDGWRDVPIVKLVDHGMPSRAETALEKACIDTLGKLADVQDLREIRGLGVTTIDGLERAFDKFWAANPQYTKPAGKSA